MKIYVMSDIHGEFNLFIKMLKFINFSKEDKLIILGDVLDRGAYPIKTLKYIMENKNIEMIMGNHEKMFLDFAFATDEMTKKFAYQVFVQNGGYSTLTEYDKLPIDEQIEVIKYIQSLPTYKVIDNYVLVHSGVNMTGIKEGANVKEIMNLQSEEDLLWSREEFYNSKGIEDYTVIFGHTPTVHLGNDMQFMIWHDKVYNDKIGIDCGATFKKHGGVLGCIRLDDKKEFYII